MKLEHAAAASTSRSFGPGKVHLSGSFRLLARGGWLVLVILTLAIFFASPPVYVALLQTPCTGSACEWQQLTPGQVGVLKEIGLSLGAYAAIIVALTLASVVQCVVVSTLIISRRSHDRMALLVALMLVTLGPTMSTTALLQSSPLAGAGRMPDLPQYYLTRARLLPVSQWAVRASLDRLSRRRVSCWASLYFLLSPPPPEYTSEPASLSRVSRRGGDSCGRSTVPLPAGVQSPRASADQMGGLRSHYTKHSHCSLDCAVSDLPGALFARFTLSAG